jgi:hypothetical protein
VSDLIEKSGVSLDESCGDGADADVERLVFKR